VALPRLGGGYLQRDRADLLAVAIEMAGEQRYDLFGGGHDFESLAGVIAL
jgi:hypothetical protein